MPYKVTCLYRVELTEVHSNALSVLAAAACFAVSTTAFGLVFLSGIRK